MPAKLNPPTIADVARKAGVSIATVSRVLNGSSPVIDATAGRVSQAIAELNYTPRSAARVLARQRTDAIGVMLPEISGAFFSPMLRGIETGVREADFGLLVQSTPAPRTGRRSIHALGEHNTDGLILFPDSMDESEIRRLAALNFPLVLTHLPPPPGLDIPMVTVENLAGARSLVEHLITAHARKRIVFLRGPAGHADSILRERGYRQALKNHRITFDPGLVLRGDFDADVARGTVQELLRSGKAFDAVFAGDDEAAGGVLLALSEAGLRVPEDVSVTGFDDVDFARYLNPPLTTMRAPTEQVGLEAVRQLVKLIRGQPAVHQVVLPTTLVIRQSCGCKGSS